MKYEVTNIDYTGFRRKQKIIQQKLKQAGDESVKTLCQLGKAHAKTIAPFYSGILAGAISYRTSNGTQGEVYIRDMKDGGNTTIKLAKWMHQTKGEIDGKKWIRSGSPTFMYRTKDYLETIKKKVAKGHFDKIKIQ